MNRIPAPALLLAVAGLIPFLWAALTALGLTSAADWNLPAVLGGDGRLLMVRYGGIILPFMAGTLWGFATRATGGLAFAAYTASVAPALWWFFMPGTTAETALINMAIGFAALLLIEVAFDRWELTPPWWLAFRIQLTIVVLACIGIGIWA
ncbi:hypothetical protein BOO69_01630 [Sulfitobacter alexandrii]|uniref:DUF3429 domain-containing protein n=1 Tax=Sulfitobacter alexandrii TaxID=1917485 RepID=A0A1J0WD82_9RHOB|nr:DUF3429 domain-containing protein [Sulfitobacter alexandrii]APE42259.1 hypothetical protein BOO69_01630 [Sulfitobacter alexandrii]